MECKNCDFWEDEECHDSDEFIDEDGIDSCRYREGSFLKPSINKSKLNDGVMPRVIDKMHLDFERFISSTLNWPIERTGPRYHDDKTAGAWQVFKFAKVA